MGDKQENKQENVLKFSFLFVNFTATSAITNPVVAEIFLLYLTSAKINSANF